MNKPQSSNSLLVRLRSEVKATASHLNEWPCGDNHTALMDETADEIERLRTELFAAQQAVFTEGLTVERLRAALERISKLYGPAPDADCAYCHSQKIARKALAPEGRGTRPADEGKPVQGPYVPKTSEEADAALAKAFDLQPEVKK